ncbi:MAG: hypothetical protein A2284_14990 [Deltaproteobacteria bacterium RIFOXYA12_FULL_61_11]|nr:MAG: hypothetical protein A2284_14990 [Deltaproteobacteria bacterium RIFOXYA12_FULL_61_11]
MRQRGEYRKAASILGTLYKKTKNKGYQKDITTIKRSSRKHFATGRSLLKRAGSLEKEGRQLEKVRRRSGTSAAALKQCTRASKKLRMRVEKLEVETNSLPPVFGELLAPVLEHLGDCVSCLSTAKESCMAVAANQKKARLELKSQNYP